MRISDWSSDVCSSDLQAVADTFRSVWLAALARRKDWPAFRAAWDPSIDDVALRCAVLDARQATGATDAQWIKDAQDIWRSRGTSLPDACDPAFAALAAQGTSEEHTSELQSLSRSSHAVFSLT